MKDVVIDFSDEVLSETQREFKNYDGDIAVLSGPQGEGKCLSAGTPIIMYDGSLQSIENIVVGDLVMGPDSTPRKVLKTSVGEEEMFRVVPIKGEPFECNASHILSLKRSGTKSRCNKRKGEIANIRLCDYLKKSNTFKLHHLLWRVGVEFADKDVSVDPYFLGLWLGDGSESKPSITTADKEIVDYLYSFAEENNTKISINHHKENKSNSYLLTNGNDGKKNNPITNKLRGYNVLKNKHIPLSYKANSRQKRLELLAGLIDSDGWPNRCGYQIVQKRKQLAKDIAFIARSLGFGSECKETKRGIKGLDFIGTYYRVTINGDCSIIPVKIANKEVPKRKQKKSILVTGIKEVVPLGIGEYHGIVLGGDHLYLLGDFTVTHNTYAWIAGIFKMVTLEPDKKLRVAIIRDKHTSIRRHTVPSMMKATKSMFPLSYNDTKWVVRGKDFLIDCDLFGMMDLGSISNLQGGEYDVIVCEEPAPVIQTGSDGIREEHFNMMVARCSSRTLGRKAKLMVAMNPPEEDHWSFNRFWENPEFPIDVGDRVEYLQFRHFKVPYGENTHVSQQDRAKVKAAFRGDEGMMTRFVKGLPSFTIVGEKVVPAYDEEVHRSVTKHDPIAGIECIRGWDGGHWPSCSIMQFNPRGQLVVLDTLRGEKIGVKQLINEFIKPLMAIRYQHIASWRDIGDHSMQTGSEADISFSAAGVIESELDTRFEPGPLTNEQYHIKEAMDELFRAEVDGMPKCILSKHEGILHRGLRGGWHYPKDPSGRVIRDRWLKNAHSHPAEAFANAVCRLLGKTGAPLGRINLQEVML